MLGYEVIEGEFLDDEIFDSKAYGTYDELILDISKRMKNGDSVAMGPQLKVHTNKGLLLRVLNKINLVDINSMNILICQGGKREKLKLCIWIQRYIDKIIEIAKYDNFITDEILDYVVACICLFEYLEISINKYDISDIHKHLQMDNKDYEYLNKLYTNITMFRNRHVIPKNMSKYTAKYNTIIKYITNISTIYNRYVKYMTNYNKYNVDDIYKIGISLANTINLAIVLYYNKRTNMEI